MSDNLSSANVHVFPAPNRDPSRSDAYLLSEKNLGGIFRALYKRNNCSFVSSITPNADSTTYDAVFVLYGFYFEVTGISNSDIYASIYVYEKDGDIHLVASDGTLSTPIDTDGGNMVALFFSDTAPTKPADLPTDVQIYTIQLKETKADGTTAIPEASKMKWNADTLNQSISISDSALVINTNPDNHK